MLSIIKEDHIHAIADDMLQRREELLDLPPSLLSGLSGATLFIAEYAKQYNKEIYFELISDMVDTLLERMKSESIAPTLSQGLPGILYACNYLSKLDLLSFDGDDDIDIYLSGCLEFFIKNDYNWDLLHGFIGVANSMLMYKEPERYTRLFEYTVEVLKKIRQQTPNGICWDSHIGFSEVKLFNTGLSHGFPAIIIYLTKLYSLNIRREDTKELIDASLKFIVPYIDQLSVKQLIPCAISSTIPNEADKTSGGRNGAWCYGDFGIILALIHAGKSLQNQEYLDLARDLAIRTAHPDYDITTIYSPTFCHGHIGVAYIYHLLSDYFNLPELAICRDKQLELMFQHYYKPGIGIGGFQNIDFELNDDLRPYDDAKLKCQDDFGLIEGSAGIGLVLMSILGKTECNWDLLFYTDIL